MTKKYLTIPTIIIITLGALLGITPLTPAAVDINFSYQTDQWERNGIYEIRVLLTNNDAQAVKIAGVQADFAYESEDFKEAPILVHDYITGYSFTVNTVNTLTEGLVYYSKGIKVTGSPNYFIVNGNSSKTLVTFRLRVENEAALGSSNLPFLVTVAVDKRRDGGGTESVMGSANNGSVTVIEDLTPPNTYARPTGRTLIYGNSTLVMLDETTSPNYDDLQRVYYEVGEPPVTDPTTGSLWVPEGGTIQLPENDASHPGSITGVLKFFGQDYWGNDEASFNTETYTIDMIKLTLSNLSRTPEIAKLGTRITANFTVDELPASPPEVTVNNHVFTLGGSYPNYSYTYDVQASDAEGNRPIRIEVTDDSGNQTIDTSLSVLIDMNDPSFTPVDFSPSPAYVGNTLTITFDASEELNTALTEVSIDGNSAAYQDHSGLRYTYSYPVQGTEASSFVKVHGYDMAGNDAWNNDDWGIISVSGSDQYSNPGSSSSTVGINWRRAP